MIEGRFSAMGTDIAVVAGRPESIASVELVFMVVESICTRFSESSELSSINSSDAAHLQLSPLLAEVMAWAQELRSRTDGLVDPAVGERVRAWGYDRTFAEMGPLATPPPARDLSDWSVKGRSLRREPDLVLDLGGIAKGWCCDFAIDMTAAAVVNAGGDIRSVDPELKVSVKDPWGEDIAVVAVGNGGLATSTIARRAWSAGDRLANHIIDPRTREPSRSPVISATAVADTAVEAEAAAKAILLLGEGGLAWASQQDWIRGGLVVWSDLRVFATSGLEIVS